MTVKMKEKYRYVVCLFAMLLSLTMAKAQKACVIANAENHVPLREALIHTDRNHWARTDYRGYFTMKYAFDSATVSKPGFVKTTIYYKNLPDTVFLLPETQQLGTVEVWGKDQEHVGQMELQIQQAATEAAPAVTGVSMDMLGWMDRRGARDRKHLKKAKKVFSEMEEKKDPIEQAYEEATGKKVLKKPEEIILEKEKDDAQAEENQVKE